MLPTRLKIGGDEALDSYLERLAKENDLTSAHLESIIARGTGIQPAQFSLIAPTTALLVSLSETTGLSQTSLRAATLQRFGGNAPLNLSGAKPDDPRSFRTLSARGWFPLRGTQICPKCLRETRQWSLYWRLPQIAVCHKHCCYLVQSCDGCEQRFRSRDRGLLRPVIELNDSCGNQLALRSYCQHTVSDHDVRPAPTTVVTMNAAVRAAIDGKLLHEFGQKVPATRYLADLRSLATLIAHIATRSAPSHAHDWAEMLAAEAQARSTEHRGPRWGIRPPDKSEARAAILTEAHSILACVNYSDAAGRMSQWLSHIPVVPSGPAGWARNRAPASPTITTLIHDALESRQSPSRRLARINQRPIVADCAIPQCIPLSMYRDTLAGMLGSRDDTGRRFGALCLAKLNRPGRTWAEAATALDLPPELGILTARTVRQRMTVPTTELIDPISSLAATLNSTTNYRDRELHIRWLNDHRETWREDWLESCTPRRHPTTIAHAITWMWTEYAHADISTCPAWLHQPPHSRQKALYAAFAKRLPPTATATLKALARLGPILNG